MAEKVIKIGIAGMGAIGSAAARALLKGIDGFELTYACDIEPPDEFSDLSFVDFATLAQQCDLIIEALPPDVVPTLTEHVFAHNKNLILVSSSALLIHPEILTQHERSNSRILVPTGALAGLDGVSSLKQMGIKSARIASTKPPQGYKDAPYVIEHDIDLDSITEKTKIFSGYAIEAAKAFPANVNVAATLSLAGIGAEKTWVEVWADPAANGNSHAIEVIGGYSQITATVTNTPDPANPKSSMLAAQSVVSLLKKNSEALVVL